MEKVMTFGNLGITPAVAMLIVSLVTEGMKLGYNYYTATQYAVKQASVQRSTIQANRAQIAVELHKQYPNVSFDAWLSILDNAILLPSPELKNETGLTKYLPFITLGILIFILIKAKR